MRIIFFSLGLFISVTFLKAQGLAIELKYGIGTYWNRSLKQLNKEIAADFPVEPKTTENFPPYFYPEIEVLINIGEKVSIGTSFRYMTTGARNYYEDYSGRFNSDIIINGYSLGGTVNVDLAELTNQTLSFYGTAATIYNTMNIKSNLVIGNNNESNTTDFFSVNFAIEPGIAYQLLINKFYLKSSLGLEFDIPSKIYLIENTKYYVQDDTGNPVRINWSGVRFSIGLGINL